MRIFFLSLFLLFLPPTVFAKYDPRTVPNNKYGIHVADVNDIADTQPLVNSSGGDWGYVTIVMQENDRDIGKWQGIFNQMRRLHLIPLVRLATRPVGDTWKQPEASQSHEWANFLNKLNWPIENRYVIIFNEPNHAKEWGNTIDPEGYAKILAEYASALKTASNDFFILPAGFDSSATNTQNTIDVREFIRRMLIVNPNIFDLVDGWTSHSYPNPGFSGSPYADGKGTIRSYLWELSYIQKNLPVFITETGWLNSTPNNISIATATVWQDPIIVAVTPFVFNYQSFPFLNFSWKKLGGSEFYPHYYAYQNIPKVQGKPKQHHSFSIIQSLLPHTLVASSQYHATTQFKNDGQAIIGEKEGYTLSIGSSLRFEVISDSVPTVEPGETATINAVIKTSDDIGETQVSIFLQKNEEKFPLEESIVTFVPPPSLSIDLKAVWPKTINSHDVTVLIYDKMELIHKFTGLEAVDGHLAVTGLTSIIPGNSYRIVVLIPLYLPKQNIQTVESGNTHVSLTRFIPLDFDLDGAFTFHDIIALLQKKPYTILRLFFEQ